MDAQRRAVAIERRSAKPLPNLLAADSLYPAKKIDWIGLDWMQQHWMGSASTWSSIWALVYGRSV